MITQNELKQILNYDPITGLFTQRVIRKGSKRKVGEVVGWINTSHNGYKRIRIGINNKDVSAHKLAFLYMTGSFPKQHIDHINHDGTDNRWVNLREVPHQENMKNKSMQPNNTSGVTGVSWCSTYNRWKARLSVAGKTLNLGSFINKNDAILARITAEKEHGFHINHGRS